MGDRIIREKGRKNANRKDENDDKKQQLKIQTSREKIQQNLQ